MRPQAHRQVGFYGIGGGSDASQAAEAGSGERRSLGAFAFNFPILQYPPPRCADRGRLFPLSLGERAGVRVNPSLAPPSLGQLPHVRQVAIRAIVIESIAHHEYVRHVEPGVVGFHAIHSAGWLVEQRADADGFRA